MSGHLVLEDGTVLEGSPFGSDTAAFGELVFNTSMTGYQEALTDPSYAGQLLMFTYPLIGNYGVHPDANESDGVQAWGSVVREVCERPFHPHSTRTLDQFLEEAGIPGLAGVDTRALTVRVREHGVLRAAIVPDGTDLDGTLAKVKAMESPDRTNLVGQVSVPKITEWGGEGPRVVVMDYGCKHSILRNLERYFEVVRSPWNASAKEVLDLEPAGVLLSNGPGDPAHPEMLAHAVPTIRDLVGEVPMYGICLGHQLLSLALGGTTFKLKFGHRGSNQPVQDLATRKVLITSQNHGFAVSPESLKGVSVIESNANDGTVEGLAVPDKHVFSVQYHPEANPGPLDAEAFFQRFSETVAKNRGRN